MLHFWQGTTLKRHPTTHMSHSHLKLPRVVTLFYLHSCPWKNQGREEPDLLSTPSALNISPKHYSQMSLAWDPASGNF